MADYGGFKGIIREAQAIAEEDRNRTIVDCPECGRPLDVNSAGVKNCPMGHYRTRGGR